MGDRPTLSAVTTTTKKLPSRMILHAIPKWGKTSFASMAPKPIFLMTRGEDGLLSLMDSGLVPPTPHFPETLRGWPDLMLALSELNVGSHEFRTVVIDTLNGAERLAHEHACTHSCGGDWEKFDAYGRGTKISLPLVIDLTTALDRLREKGMSVILLAHSQVKTFRNPSGADYDRWEPVLAKESWAHLDRWADMILFGMFEVVAEEKRGQSKAKAKGGKVRLLMTERQAEFDAGNRHGLPSEIECGESAQEAWANFAEALKGQVRT